MEKKNNGLVVLVIILVILVLCLGGYIVYDKLLDKDNNVIDKNNETSIKINDELDYVYDASYFYDSKYKEYSRNFGGESSIKDEVITISSYGIPVEYTTVSQKLNDLKVPYLNIKSDYANSTNKELEDLYVEYAKDFDTCAENTNSSGCSQVLTYRTYKYNNLLSVVVIYGKQTTGSMILSYKVYNFDLTTGNEVKYNEMVTKLGYDSNTLLEKEKKLLNDKMDELWKGNEDLAKACNRDDNNNCYNFANDILETSIDDGSILYFTNNDGKLNIFAIPYYEGVQNGDLDLYLIEIDK